jgi:hypothetical protein
MEMSGRLHASPPPGGGGGGKTPRYVLDRRLVGPQSWSGRCGEEIQRLNRCWKWNFEASKRINIICGYSEEMCV